PSPGAGGSLNALFRTFLQGHTHQAHGPAEAPHGHQANGRPPASAQPEAEEAEVRRQGRVLARLGGWQGAGACEDCPLPELYRRVSADDPALTVGRFHDALRQLHEAGQVYLHPWTGPLYDIPEPPYALLVGHEVAYYASVRRL